MSDPRLVASATRRTLQGVDAGEAVGSGCAWGLVALLPVSVGFLVALVAPWTGAAIALSSVVGAWGLHRLAQGRIKRALPLLKGFDVLHLPSWSVPMRSPRGERLRDGLRRVWRITWFGPPNGRSVVAEVAVERATRNAWFVVWPATRPRPRETRTLEMVIEPVVAGYLVASPDVASTAACLRDPMVRELLFELLGEHDELSVYPFAAWWRTRDAVDPARLWGAEGRLVQLTEVLASR